MPESKLEKLKKRQRKLNWARFAVFLTLAFAAVVQLEVFSVIVAVIAHCLVLVAFAFFAFAIIKIWIAFKESLPEKTLKIGVINYSLRDTEGKEFSGCFFGSVTFDLFGTISAVIYTFFVILAKIGLEGITSSAIFSAIEIGFPVCFVTALSLDIIQSILQKENRHDIFLHIILLVAIILVLVVPALVDLGVYLGFLTILANPIIVGVLLAIIAGIYLFQAEKKEDIIVSILVIDEETKVNNENSKEQKVESIYNRHKLLQTSNDSPFGKEIDKLSKSQQSEKSKIDGPQSQDWERGNTISNSNLNLIRTEMFQSCP